jgi:hypothetical protein
MSKEEYKILPYFFGNKLLVIDIFGFIGTRAYVFCYRKLVYATMIDSI